MKVKCINKVGKDLSEKAGYPSEYESLSLIVEKEYIVYSMGVWDEYLFYLLKPDHEDSDLNIDPVWYPFEWFEIIDHKMPENWLFDPIGGYDKIKLSVVWGYKEMVLDPDHEDGLMERNNKDLAIFYERKKEIDALSM